MRKTTQDFPVKRQYYYIIDFRNMMNPVLLPVCFVNRNAAKRILEANIPNRNKRRLYSVIKGLKIKEEQIPYIVSYGNYLRKGGKYLYDEDKQTKQERKSFRTLMRRRLRRMDLLTTNRIKYRYHEKAKKVKHTKNYQTVAQSPHTDARVFQLDRKPNRYYYIILKKCPSSKRGKLFKIKCIQVNVKTGKWKKVTIQTNRNDIFIPELLNNLKKIPNAEGAIEAYSKYRQRKQENVL